MIEMIVLSTLLFQARVNEIRVQHGMERIEFSMNRETVEYASECDPVRKNGTWMIMSAGHSSCGKNTPVSRADMIYWLDYQYKDMKSPLFDSETKTLSAAVKYCPNDKIFVVVDGIIGNQ